MATSTPLLDAYYERHDHPPADVATRILLAIVDDLFDRRGIDNVWDDMTPEDREELLETNLQKIRKELQLSRTA